MAGPLGGDEVRTLETGAIRAGRTEALSLTATFAFGSEEIVRARPGDRAMRVWLHETMHAYQAMATPYGYLLHALRSFQTGRVMRVLRALGEGGIGPDPPLMSQTSRLPSAVRARVEPDVRGWLLAEVVILYLEGDTDRFTKLAASGMFGGRSFASLFGELEYTAMAPFFLGAGHRIIDDLEGHRPVEDLRLEEAIFGFKLFHQSGVGDTLSVLESGAKMIEWWRAWPAGLTELSESLAAGARNTVGGNAAYRMWIRHALNGGLGARDARSFALTYSALVDLALNAPLLPHHAELRRSDTNAGDLMPIWRLVTAIGAVAEDRIPPIVDLHADYEGFVEAVCAARSWPTPAELTAATIDRFPIPTPSSDPAQNLHLLACAYRAADPVAFQDMDVWWTDSDEAREFCDMFRHPVAQFADEERLLFGSPDHAFALVSNFVVHRYMTTLMTSTMRPLPPVELPYRARPDELEAHRRQAETTIRAHTGLAQPRLRLVPRGGADPVHAPASDDIGDATATANAVADERRGR